MDRSGGDTGFAALVTESDGASGQKEKEADSPDTPGEAFYQEDTPEAETPGSAQNIPGGEKSTGGGGFDDSCLWDRSSHPAAYPL